MAGIRTSAVAVVATATLLAYVGGGGLGRFIIDGSRISYDDPRIFVGALFVALLSIIVELVLALVATPHRAPRRCGGAVDDRRRVADVAPTDPCRVTTHALKIHAHPNRKDSPMKNVRLRPTGRAVGVLLLALVLVASGCGSVARRRQSSVVDPSGAPGDARPDARVRWSAGVPGAPPVPR